MDHLKRSEKRLARTRSILSFFVAHYKSFLFPGYVVAGLWLTATASAALSLSASVPPLLAVPSLPSETPPAFDVPFSAPSPEDVPDLRDPFSKINSLEKTFSKKIPMDPSGLQLRAIILSLKNGVVLEDNSGGVYFLSEGESANGILVKTIVKTGVTVEVDGEDINLTMGEQ